MPKVAITDRMFISAEKVLPQHVACLGIFTKPDDAPGDYVQQRMDELREIRSFAIPFNYRLAQGPLRGLSPEYDELADDEIDIDFHLRLDALATPGSERQLGVLVSRLHSYPLDMTRPLWEFHLIDGIEGNRFALYFKVHHALMDGVAGSLRLQQMVTGDPTDPELRPLWSVGPKAHRRKASRSLRAGDRLKAAGHAIAEGGRTAGGLSKVGAGMVRDISGETDPDLAVPYKLQRTILNGRIGAQRRVATQVYEFERIRNAAKKSGGTVNDVFLAIAGGGLRRYLADLGELPDASLLAGTPVNVRVEGDQGSTNAFTMTVMKLGTDVADPLERIQAIGRSSKAAKQHLDGLPKAVAANYGALFMTPFLGAHLTGLGGRTRPPYHVAVSNVPGQTTTQYWAGAELQMMCPFGIPYHGVGLFIASLTVSGKFCVGLVGDRDALPHLQRLAVYMGEALEELEALL